MSTPTPNYYAIIPASVRYHEGLSANAKLLYGEITALCQSAGYCWATNSYFATLYRVASTTISEWVGALRKAGFIRIEVDVAGGNARKIWLVGALPEIPKTSSGKAEDPSSGKAEDNNTRENTKKNKAVALAVVESQFLFLNTIRTEWEQWKDHLKQKGKAITANTARLQLEDLTAMGEARAKAMIRHSIKGGFQGLYEPKDAPQKSAPVAGKAPGRGY